MINAMMELEQICYTIAVKTRLIWEYREISLRQYGVWIELWQADMEMKIKGNHSKLTPVLS